MQIDSSVRRRVARGGAKNKAFMAATDVKV
jgi:hypothetical protein